MSTVRAEELQETRLADTESLGKIYDELDYYKEWRRPGPSRERYLSEIDEWKSKYLAMLFPDAQSRTIVEIGCGTGDLIGRFPRVIPSKSRYGIDISQLNIDFARKKYPEVNFYKGTFEEFLKDKGKKLEIGVVILSDVLEHVENDIELLRNAGEHAEYVLVNIPMEKCLEERKANYGYKHVSGHLRAYGLKDVQNLIANAGLRIVDFTVRYYCRELIYKELQKEQLLTSVSMRSLLARSIPTYVIHFLTDNLLFRVYKPSNFFGLLSKVETSN